ncbi:heavy-metal-associated domain-containing protein, partial [Streptomyces alboverticillatus]
MTSQMNSTSCCTPAGTCGSAARADVQVGITTVYKVTGMTCGHCEGSVSREVSAIPGVTSVKAVAATGLLTITSTGTP